MLMRTTLVSFCFLATAGALADAPTPSPTPSPTGLIQPLWQVRDSRGSLLTQWKAERVFETQQALLTRSKIAGAPDAQPSPMVSPLTVPLQPGTDSQLRDRVQTLILRVPGKDESGSQPDDCPHWIALESVTGKKFYCDRSSLGDPLAPESKAALDLVQDLGKLTNDQPAVDASMLRSNMRPAPAPRPAMPAGAGAPNPSDSGFQAN